MVICRHGWTCNAWRRGRNILKEGFDRRHYGRYSSRIATHRTVVMMEFVMRMVIARRCDCFYRFTAGFVAFVFFEGGSRTVDGSRVRQRAAVSDLRLWTSTRDGEGHNGRRLPRLFVHRERPRKQWGHFGRDLDIFPQGWMNPAMCFEQQRSMIEDVVKERRYTAQVNPTPLPTKRIESDAKVSSGLITDVSSLLGPVDRSSLQTSSQTNQPKAVQTTIKRATKLMSTMAGEECWMLR